MCVGRMIEMFRRKLLLLHSRVELIPLLYYYYHFHSKIELIGTVLSVYLGISIFHKFINSYNVIYAVILGVIFYDLLSLFFFVCCLNLCILPMFLCCLCNWLCGWYAST